MASLPCISFFFLCNFSDQKICVGSMYILWIMSAHTTIVYFSLKQNYSLCYIKDKVKQIVDYHLH